ncbi:lipocalin-like domain-containing protein [Sphingobium sp. AS12]|uniref:lipocalin-like domain-containing protein n=1 Tax=Sphingobium sp. AS12 TaxID=2849495 RepID=UPI001C313E72|nr:lipocalin-like domain-containing protein [Sphingobium sp. AS12]MBV2149848.1 lipocalin-like domain-containing protein [Sphingobium sp. AS12]
MNSHVLFGRRALLALAAAVPVAAAARDAASRPVAPSLAGTWTLVAADRRLPDGSVTRDYGAAPQGRLMIDDAGRYALQIFRAERPDFAAGDKGKGTDAEMRAAVMGSSTHFGSLTVDGTARTLRFAIEDSSFPNWRGQVQVRSFTLDEDVLTWEVPPRPDGSVPISVWRRVSRPTP